MVIEIVELSIKNRGSFHSYVTVYQRAYSILAPRHFENRFMFDPQPSILRTTAGKRGSFINPGMPRRIAVSPLHHDAQLKLSPKRRSFSTVKRWLLHLADFQCVLGRGHELCIELSAPIKSTDLAEMVCAGICIMDVYVLDFPGPEPVTKRNQNTRPKLMKHAGPDASLWHKSNIFMTKWFSWMCACVCVCVAIMSHK